MSIVEDAGASNPKVQSEITEAADMEGIDSLRDCLVKLCGKLLDKGEVDNIARKLREDIFRLKDISMTDLVSLLDDFDVRQVTDGRPILTRGSDRNPRFNTTLFLVIKGRVKVSRKGQYIGTNFSPTFSGELEWLNELPIWSDNYAVGDVVCLYLDKTKIDDARHGPDKIGRYYDLLKIVAWFATKRHMEIFIKNQEAHRRFASQKGNRFPAKRRLKEHIEAGMPGLRSDGGKQQKITHQMIADETLIARPTVTTFLKEWSNKEWIIKSEDGLYRINEEKESEFSAAIDAECRL